MSSETTEPGGKKKLPLVIAIVLGVVAGGAGGAFLAGPLLAERAPAVASHDEEGESGEEEDGHEEEEAPSAKKGKGAEKGPRPMHLMQNLVVNPAASSGTRFLMVSLAMEVQSPAIAEEITARDAEVRDAVLRVLGSKTVDELTDLTARDSLRTELGTAVSDLIRKGAVRRVYFPQFVIQ